MAWSEEKELDCSVKTFSSAESLLFHGCEEFDILLLDIEMGDMDGVTMARYIRKENAAVQIVFITGYSDYIAEGYEVEALHYLIKPATFGEIEKIFERLWRNTSKPRACWSASFRIIRRLGTGAMGRHLGSMSLPPPMAICRHACSRAAGSTRPRRSGWCGCCWKRRA
jgi:DNA-binding LytR/AlgR family response regulator